MPTPLKPGETPEEIAKRLYDGVRRGDYAPITIASALKSYGDRRGEEERAKALERIGVLERLLSGGRDFFERRAGQCEGYYTYEPDQHNGSRAIWHHAPDCFPCQWKSTAGPLAVTGTTSDKALAAAPSGDAPAAFTESTAAPDCAHGWAAQTGGHPGDCVQCAEEGTTNLRAENTRLRKELHEAKDRILEGVVEWDKERAAHVATEKRLAEARALLERHLSQHGVDWRNPGWRQWSTPTPAMAPDTTHLGELTVRWLEAPSGDAKGTRNG